MSIESLISEQGIVGVGLLISMGVNAALWKRLVTVTDDRLTDIKNYAGELATVAREVARSMDGLTRVLEVKHDP